MFSPHPLDRLLTDFRGPLPRLATSGTVALRLASPPILLWPPRPRPPLRHPCCLPSQVQLFASQFLGESIDTTRKKPCCFLHLPGSPVSPLDIRRDHAPPTLHMRMVGLSTPTSALEWRSPKSRYRCLRRHQKAVFARFLGSQSLLPPCGNHTDAWRSVADMGGHG